MENAYRCIFDEKLFTSYKCSLSECKSCGFNPEVNQRRREEIYRLAAHGRLSEWGKPKTQDEGEAIEP